MTDVGGSPRNPGDRYADGLDDANWAILREVVIAAHRGDAHAAAAVVRRFDTDVPVDGHAGTYLWWLLRHRVAQLLGRRPARGDITQIAGYLEERFGGVIPDVTLLQDVLLTAWNLGPRERELSSGQFLVAGVTALGVLLREPEADLEAARPDLAAWWQANLDKFRAQGILEDRSGVPGRPLSWQVR